MYYNINSYLCKICDKIIDNNDKETYINLYFCENCQFDGWRRCVSCWKMTIEDDKPITIIKCLYCKFKQNNLISFMKL